MMGRWVYCPSGSGYQHEDGEISRRRRHFKPYSVGLVRAVKGDVMTVWFIGADEVWDIKSEEVQSLDVTKTGDKYDHKICNVCHCLLPTIENFARNQNNIKGIVRRPSCHQCRTDIDKRAPKTRQAREAEKRRPQKGDVFQCPICRRRSIAYVTAKVVADHNHHTGNIRDFICDSCNTGLGRFKNGDNYLRNAIAYLEERDDM